MASTVAEKQPKMEDSLSYVGIAKFFAPKIPSIVGAAAWHSLSLTPTASKWDFRTAVIMGALRALHNSKNPSPVGRTQALTLRDSGPKGKLWIAPATIAAPSDSGSRDAVIKAVTDMGDGTESYTKPDSVDIRVEWTGFRSDAKSADEPLPSGLTPQERYNKLNADPSRTSKVTILYFHGGAYYLCGLATHRLAIAKLARTSGGRALAVEYRLAPQAAFPAQLLDALDAYLYLLHPPSGALHEPVPANEIVFAGDSAGGNLAFALLQLLLQFRRASSGSTPKIMHNGREVDVPLPAGVSSSSPWLDITRSSPSVESNQTYDYLPTATHDASVPFPKDNVWPANPPRGDLFCDISLLSHPLVSPLTAQDWKDSPPLFITVGDEALYDEGAVVATRAREQGVTVQWEHYEAMPHCFSMVFAHIPTGKQNYRNWGQFAKDAVQGVVKPKTEYIHAKSAVVDQVKLEIGAEAPFAWEKAVEYVKDVQRRRQAGYERETQINGVPTLGKPNL